MVNFKPELYYSVSQVSRRKWKNGPVEQIKLKMVITKNIDHTDGLQLQSKLLLILESAVNEMLSKAPKSNSVIQLLIVNPYLRSRCISSRRVPAGQLSFPEIVERLCRAVLSDERIDLESTDFFLVIHTLPQVGARGQSRCSVLTRTEWSRELWARKKLSLVNPLAKSSQVPKSLRNQCVALILARQLYVLEHPNIGWRKEWLYSISKECRREAESIVRKAGLDPSRAPYSFDQLRKFESVLPPNVAMRLFLTTEPFMTIGKGGTYIDIFCCIQDESGDGDRYHAYLIKKLKKFLGGRSDEELCLHCLQLYRTGAYGVQLRGHVCGGKCCKRCGVLNCPNTDNDVSKIRRRVSCDQCHVQFSTQICFESHLPTCRETGELCQTCRHWCPKGRIHRCGYVLCSTCQTEHHALYLCYVQRPPIKAQNKPVEIFYADIEAFEDVDGNHRGNLVILQQSDWTQGSIGKDHLFTGENAVRDFVRSCFTDPSPFQGATIIFHNAAGYDAHHLLKELRKAGLKYSFINRQQKLISVNFSKNKILDSYQFVSKPAGRFPKDILDYKLAPKVNFLIKLNGRRWVDFGKQIIYQETIDGVLHRFPPKRYFITDNMSTKARQEFDAWHSSQVDMYREDSMLAYCPETELIRYCRQDVCLLREGFETFRRTWLAQYPELEPVDYLTFPSLNNALFRARYMPERSLALIPPQGYAFKNQPTSMIALAWISWCVKELSLDRGTLRTGAGIGGGQNWWAPR